jgi:integrase
MDVWMSHGTQRPPGTIYRRKVRVCTTCEERLDTTAQRRRCETAGHAITIREQSIWWIRYQVDGRVQCVTTRSTDRAIAEHLLRTRAIPCAVPVVVPPAAPLGFDEAVEDLLADYRMNGKRSLRTVTLRINKHLRPIFRGQALPAITTSRVRDYILHRQAEGASNATVNRDLIVIKRLFSLAVRDGKLPTKPYIPLLREQNIRRGFFEVDQFLTIRRHLPAHMQNIAAFAFITGWRTPSEILPLEWRQVDWHAGEIRLDPGTTKNGEGRVFPLTTELRRVLECQRRVKDTLTARTLSVRHVFCYTIGVKAGQGITEGAFTKAWRKARVLAGCPDRIPHDFRRTAVRNLVRAGVPERVAMHLTGHKTRAIFERYNIVSPGDLREAAERLNQYTSAVI